MSNSTPPTQLVTIEQTDNLVVIDRLPDDRNPPLVYLAGLASEQSRRVQWQAMRVVAELLGSDDPLRVAWGEMRFQHVNAIRAALIPRYSAASANRIMSALKGTLKNAWRLEMMSAENYARAVDVKSIIGKSLPAGRALSSGEIYALTDDCAGDTSNAGARDAAILGIAYGAGLRRAEIVGLCLADYDRESGDLKIRHGKRNKQRMAHLTNGGKQALDDWLDIRGTEGEAIFCEITRGDRLINQPMTPQAIYSILKKRAARAKCQSFSPHDLRRSFASDLLDAGADIGTVSKMMGHENIETTLGYDRRPEDVRRKASELLHFPYNGRKQKKLL